MSAAPESKELVAVSTNGDPVASSDESLVEFATFCDTSPTPQEFYDGLLQRVIFATNAAGGVVWIRDEFEQLAAVSQKDVADSNPFATPGDPELHGLLLKQVFQQRQPCTIPPHGRSSVDGKAGNPSGFFLSLAALCRGEEAVGVLEIFQPATDAEQDRNVAAVLLVKFAERASEYLATMQRLEQSQSRQELWSKVEAFTRSVHCGLDSRTIGYTLVNEARRLLECDRVSVALWNGRKCRLVAISGQATFDTRANTVRLLNKLATVVARTGEPLWYSGETENLASQVEAAVDEYIDVAHSKFVAVLPLFKPVPPVGADQKPTPPEMVGTLIIEQVNDTGLKPGYRERADLVATHGATALANAVEYESLFLLPVWRTIGKSRWLVQARTLPKTVLAACALIVAIGSLFLVQTDFEIETKGTLEPVARRDVFAPQDGVITNVYVQDDRMVNAGAPLVKMTNTDAEVQLADLKGKLASTNEQLKGIDQQRSQIRLTTDEKDRLASQAAQLHATRRSLERQVTLLIEKQRQLEVVSPIAGQVVTWQPRDKLIYRPVQRGQQLLTVADPAGEWQLELHLPEERMGYVAKAQQELGTGETLPVRYILATAPSQGHQGTVQEIHTTAEFRGEEGNTILVKVQIDKNDLAAGELHPGAGVTAKIHCGRASLGYCWFKDVINFCHRLWFKL